MKKATATLFLLASVVVAAAAPPRVAVVRVADVFKQLESTAQANKELGTKRDAINQDKRLAEFQRLKADLDARAKELAPNGPDMDPTTRKKLEREYAIKHQEAKSLGDDFASYRSEQTQIINAEMVEGMKKRLAEIQSTAETIAEQEGYDFVFDSSGSTNTGVPLLLYAKKTNDLTDQVLTVLGKATTSSENDDTSSDSSKD